MKILVASDSFKGSLSSLEVAQAVKDAVSSYEENVHAPIHEVTGLPMSDGGEGFLTSAPGDEVCIYVNDPLMRKVMAIYKITKDNKAVIEMAQAAGLGLLSAEERNPELTTSYGVGEIIASAIKRGCREFFVGIGGSATNDAGVGMLSALGYRFLDKNGKQLAPVGESLIEIVTVDGGKVLPELAECSFTVACDVTNPFCGKEGAAYIFAPQKGADAAMVERLDEGMENFARVMDGFATGMESSSGKEVRSLSGVGAAGGIGGAFVAFLDAKLVRGVDFVLSLVEFDAFASDVDLVITGEGSIDAQTFMGKVPMGVLRAGQKCSVPVAAIAGRVVDKEKLLAEGFAKVEQITPEGMPLAEAMRKETAINNIKNTVKKLL